MKSDELKKYAYVAFSNRTLQGIEEGITFMVDQTDCSKEEALQIITEILWKRICSEKIILKS